MSIPPAVPPVQKARSSNLELYRIVMMTLIVAFHFYLFSGISPETEKGGYFGGLSSDPDLSSWRSWFLMTFGAWGKFGINGFVLITGYFMCRSTITLRKFLKLFLIYLFYKYTISTLAFTTGNLSLTTYLGMLIPIKMVDKSFIDSYILFFLFIPFLNAMIQNLNEKKHLLLIALSLFIYTILSVTPFLIVEFTYIIWFSILYFIASFIRFYPRKLYDNTKFWGWASLLTFGLSLGSFYVFGRLAPQLGFSSKPFYLVLDANKPLALLLAVTTFLFFKNLRIPQSRFINTVAGAAFGVLLLHSTTYYVRRLLWRDVFPLAKWLEESSGAELVLQFFGAVFIVYIVCTAIDLLRIRFVETPFFNWYDRHIDKWNARWSKVSKRCWKALGVEDCG